MRSKGKRHAKQFVPGVEATRCRPAVEALESRCVLSGAALVGWEMLLQTAEERPQIPAMRIIEVEQVVVLSAQGREIGRPMARVFELGFLTPADSRWAPIFVLLQTGFGKAESRLSSQGGEGEFAEVMRTTPLAEAIHREAPSAASEPKLSERELRTIVASPVTTSLAASLSPKSSETSLSASRTTFPPVLSSASSPANEARALGGLSSLAVDRLMADALNYRLMPSSEWEETEPARGQAVWFNLASKVDSHTRAAQEFEHPSSFAETVDSEGEWTGPQRSAQRVSLNSQETMTVTRIKGSTTLARKSSPARFDAVRETIAGSDVARAESSTSATRDADPSLEGGMIELAIRSSVAVSQPIAATRDTANDNPVGASLCHGEVPMDQVVTLYQAVQVALPAADPPATDAE